MFPRCFCVGEMHCQLTISLENFQLLAHGGLFWKEVFSVSGEDALDSLAARFGLEVAFWFCLSF